MSDAGAPPRVASPPLPHTASEQWQSFEMRMRHRRAERCRMRAQAAIETGCVEEVMEALAEARALEPDAPENAAVERLIAAIPSKCALETARIEDATGVFAEPRALQPDAPGSTDLDRLMATALPTDEQLFTVSVSDDHRRLPVTLAAIATVSIAAAGWYFWQSGVDLYLRSGGIAPVAQHAATNAAEVKPVSTLTVARTDASANQPSVSDPTAHVDEARPAAILEPSATTGMTEAAAPEETTPSAPSKAPAVETSRPAIAQPQPVSMPPSLSGAEASASPDTPIVIEGPPAAPGMPNAADAPRAADPSERAEAPRTVPGDVVAVSRPATDETPSIRAVLARYAVAYSQLDAAAAAAVWPDVDRRALTRAFETLQSQHVSLGRCDVAVSTAIAHARCSGTTAWTPKVGGGVHTAARTWTFDLAKQNDAWLISSVTVR